MIIEKRENEKYLMIIENKEDLKELYHFLNMKLYFYKYDIDEIDLYDEEIYIYDEFKEEEKKYNELIDIEDFKIIINEFMKENEKYKKINIRKEIENDYKI